ncbi:hypothetical protein B0H17DRAFT_1086651 [Mycena rosella]|uniref:Uncharacterized protein n=1 Tax=Mycena rosella TaxID=1033263 RepID=A0AAD7CXX0_MYCRO|nr:hypothetical protein B0H17DRAFT_1086651 [Mycena rosella]
MPPNQGAANSTGRTGGFGELLAAPEECCREIAGAMLCGRRKADAPTSDRVSDVEREALSVRAGREYRRGRCWCPDGWVLHHHDEAA